MNYTKLYENYYISTDPNNLILYKKINNKNNKVKYDRIGYYGRSMSKLIRGLKEQYTIDNIEDYMKQLRFDDLIKKLNEIDKIIKG